MQMNNGSLSPQDYNLHLNNLLSHHIKLCQFFKDEKRDEEAKILNNRINLLNNELQELQIFLNSQ